MAADLISTIRYGQARWRDQMLLDLAVQRGLVTAEQSAQLLGASAANDSAATQMADAASQLVTQGLLSASQLQTLAAEFDLMDVMETVADSAAPLAVQQANAKPGHRLGRYTLVEEIGAGGMGVVWRAWDNQLSRWVAVKRLKVSDSQLVSRFMREASMLAQLTHPNITAVYEVGVHEGQPFLVMELVEGGSPKAADLTRAAASAIVRDAALAVAYAHERGIVHRDLKPSNLLIGADGRVFVTDFGLARMKEEGTGLTASGAIMGTPSYMAPEQAQGREADFRTDIYGLGATLFALVEGRPPHSGELVHEVVKRVAVSNPPSIGGDDDLVVVALKAMERDREDRYQTAKELAEELDRFVRDEPITARKISSVERIWRRAKRKPGLAAGIAAGTLLGLGVTLWGASEIYTNYQRNALATLASGPITQAKTVATQLRKLYSNAAAEPQWINAALADMDKLTQEAVSLAPGLGEAEYLRGLYQLWAGGYERAQQRFDAALLDDSNLHDARAYRAVARYGANEALAPSVVQDVEGFRVQAPPPSPALDAFVARLNADIQQLPADFGLRILVQAMIATAQADFGSAVGLLQQHLDRYPYDQRVRGILQWSLLSAKEYPRVLEVSDELVRTGSNAAAALEVRAFALAGLNQPDDAITAMLRSNELQADPDKEHWVAFWDASQQRFEASLERYTKLLKANPDFVKALIGRGTALMMLAQPDSPPEVYQQALEDFNNAVRLAPENPEAHFFLAQVLSPQDPDAAAVHYARTMALDPASYGLHGNRSLAINSLNSGDMEGAKQYLRLALAAEPTDAASIDLLVRVSLINDDPAGALATIDEFPSTANLLLLKSSALVLQGEYTAAHESAQEAAAMAPNEVSVQLELGDYAAKADAFAAAEVAFAKAESLALAAEQTSDEERLARLQRQLYTWWATSQAELGIEVALRMRKLAPLSAETAQQVADFWLLKEQPNKALGILSEAIKAQPNLLGPQNAAALILAQLGRAGDAEQYLPLLAQANETLVLRGYLLGTLTRCAEAQEIAAGLEDLGLQQELNKHLASQCSASQ